MTRTAKDRKRRIIREVFSEPELRKMFTDRTDEDLFREIGIAVIGSIREAALKSLGLAHLVIWTGYEFLIDIERKEV